MAINATNVLFTVFRWFDVTYRCSFDVVSNINKWLFDCSFPDLLGKFAFSEYK